MFRSNIGGGEQQMDACQHEGWDGYGNCPTCGLAQESNDGARIRRDRKQS